MSNALLSIRTDNQTKQEIADFAASLGLSVSAFATVVLKQAMRERRVVLTPDLEPTPYLESVMRDAETDHKTGQGITHTKGRTGALAHLDGLMKK